MYEFIIAMLDVASEQINWEGDYVADGTVDDIAEKVMDLTKCDMLVPTTEAVNTLNSLIIEWKRMNTLVTA